MVDALNDVEMMVKDIALNALRRNGIPASTVLVLLERLKGGDKAVRDAAVSALRILPEMSVHATQVLIETSLKHSDKEIRDAATLALDGQHQLSVGSVLILQPFVYGTVKE
jgi:HEAT repeat protein